MARSIAYPSKMDCVPRNPISKTQKFKGETPDQTKPTVLVPIATNILAIWVTYQTSSPLPSSASLGNEKDEISAYINYFSVCAD